MREAAAAKGQRLPLLPKGSATILGGSQARTVESALESPEMFT